MSSGSVPQVGATILAVCTGNICRSPMVERMLAARLRALLGAGGPVTVASAGTYALVGEAMDPLAAQMLAERDVPGDGFTARLLTRPLIEAADLVLTATREHRAAVVQAVPRAAGHTFTLRELARLVDDDGVHRAVAGRGFDALVAAAAARRGFAPAGEPADDDLPDPYRGPVEGFQRVADLAAPAVDAVAAAVALAVGG